MKKNNLLPSLILMISVLLLSSILLINVLPQHNIWLTTAALYIFIFNAIVTAVLLVQRGK